VYNHHGLAKANYGIALKNADALLQDVLKAVDKNGDGIIQYTGMLCAFTVEASRADRVGQSFEHSSSRPRRSYGGSSIASIATATANWTRENSDQHLAPQACSYQALSWINSSLRSIQTTMG
jgi:hypothetical protein